jgi:hypothetical protein
MKITLEAALKTKYKEQVEAATVKECLNIINFKTFKYLRSKKHAEKTTHPSVLPCSMVVKDMRDSKGELLLWKSRFCTGGHRTDPTTYQPFDKTFSDDKYGRSIHGTHLRTAHANEHRSL